MKLTIPRTNLQAALAAVKPVARNLSPPILSNVLLVAKATPGSGSLTLTATDLDLHLRVTLNAAVAAEGKTTVRAALLSDIIRMADVPDVSLELVKNQLRIECGSARHLLPIIAPEEFPPFPAVKSQEGQGVDLALEDAFFRTMLAETSFAASTEANRFTLCGNLIKLDGAMLHVVACDGRRIAVSSTGSPIPDKAAIILPVKVVRELLRLLGSDTSKPQRLNLTATANLVQFSFNAGGVDITLMSKLIEGSYPDYNKVVPKENVIANLPRAELLRAVERIALVSDGVTFEFTGAALRLHSAGKRGASMVGEASDSLLIPANVKSPVHCTYSARYVCDTLTAIADDTLEFHLAPTGLGLFKTPSRDWRAVIAPVKKEKSKGDPKKPEPKPETTTPVK
jgi:DNA polymerase-3 subunit beta